MQNISKTSNKHMTSFFEKLTGASSPEAPQKIIKKKITRVMGSDSSKTNIEKEMKKSKKGIKKHSIDEVMEKEEKDWLDQAESEEGQLTIDVYQTESEIVIKSTVAGVNSEDIDISITNDMVTIRGKRMKDEEITTENYYYQELYWGSFSRSVILPVEVDADRAKAKIKNGILTIRLPKIEKIKTKKIRVNLSE